MIGVLWCRWGANDIEIVTFLKWYSSHVSTGTFDKDRTFIAVENRDNVDHNNKPVKNDVILYIPSIQRVVVAD